MDYYLNMAPKNINFKLLSLNARGIRSFEKRKALFGWLMKNNTDIYFLQESYSTPWGGKRLEISMERGNVFLSWYGP